MQRRAAEVVHDFILHGFYFLRTINTLWETEKGDTKNSELRETRLTILGNDFGLATGCRSITDAGCVLWLQLSVERLSAFDVESHIAWLHCLRLALIIDNILE